MGVCCSVRPTSASKILTPASRPTIRTIATAVVTTIVGVVITEDIIGVPGVRAPRRLQGRHEMSADTPHLFPYLEVYPVPICPAFHPRPVIIQPYFIAPPVYPHPTFNYQPVGYPPSAGIPLPRPPGPPLPVPSRSFSTPQPPRPASFGAFTTDRPRRASVEYGPRRNTPPSQPHGRHLSPRSSQLKR